MFRKSIKNNIVFTTLLGVGIILTFTGITANFLVVAWLQDNFDDNLLTKAHLLVTLFDEDGLEFEFAGEFMPEYDRGENPEYFQFWYDNGEIFERSSSLKGSDLPFSNKIIEDYYFENIVQIDGKEGRLLQFRFIPQLEEESRTEAHTTSSAHMILVLTRERETLDFLIFVVSFTLIFSIPAILVFIYFATRFAVDRGLRPLEELKAQLENLDVNHLSKPIIINTPVLDMENVISTINDALDRISESFNRVQRFTSDAAHELRTPIAELMNMAEVAGKWPAKVDHEDFYKDVLESSQKMQLIVNSLLELARCKNGQIKLELVELDMSECFSGCWNMYSRQAGEKKIQFRFSGGTSLKIVSSSTEFGLIISNLLSNAVEYGSEGSTVVASIQEDDGVVSVAISNMTDSLDAEDMPHIFDSLWRKDASRNSKVHIGMGLTIAKAYVEALNLTINASLADQFYSVVISGLKPSKGH